MINYSIQNGMMADANVPPQGRQLRVFEHDQMQMDGVGEFQKNFDQSTCI